MILCSVEIMAHSSFIAHCEDIMEVLGFEYNLKLFSRTTPQYNNSWTKFISSDMIDNKSFHSQLERLYPNLNITHPRNHRLLFHWPFNAKPWTPELEKYVTLYCINNKLDKQSIINIFKDKIKAEQNRRNKKMMEVTEKLFGFAHGGKDRNYTSFFVSMAYNVHLLGDQQSDNKVFTGVSDVENLIGQIIITLRLLDEVRCKPIEREITRINKQYSDSKKKADALMIYLKQTIPSFIKDAQGGSISRRLEKRGFKLK